MTASMLVHGKCGSSERRVLSGVLVLVVGLSFAACGEFDGEEPDANGGAGQAALGGWGGAGGTGGALSAGAEDGGESGSFGESGAGGRTVEGGGGGGDSENDAGSGGTGCVPKTCEELQACGGKVGDGCGAQLDCPPCEGCTSSVGPLHARRGKSEGFSGSAESYVELYDVPCDGVDDCAEACTARGGTAEMCSASECIEGFEGEPSQCLPATAWRNLEALRAEGEEPAIDSAELVLVSRPYHDLKIDLIFLQKVPSANLAQG